MIYQSYVVVCRIFARGLYFVFGLHEVCIVGFQEVCKVFKKKSDGTIGACTLQTLHMGDFLKVVGGVLFYPVQFVEFMEIC